MNDGPSVVVAVMSTLQRALLLGLGLAAVLGLLHWLGVGLWLLLAAAAIFAVVAQAYTPWGVRMLDTVLHAARAGYWRHEQGRHHAFGGIALVIEDDGRHVWVAGADLQQVLGRSEADDVLAARHAGRWRRSDDGVLMLRVDAVVEVLATSPQRTDPRVQRLRRYFERDVLYPAAQRRKRR